jgi:Putative peptidoglycan binding domain
MMPRKRTVVQGECISSLAFEHGFFPDTIWNDDGNAKLREERGDPNVLRPGDVVLIPDLRVKEVSGPTGQRHRFRRRGVPETLKIQLLCDGEPIANEKYLLTVDGDAHEGTTDAAGRLQQLIPPDAREASVRISRTGQELPLQLGHLDPIEDVAGAQARLANLGFYRGPVDGRPSLRLEEAIQAFQASRGIEPYGELDDETRAALRAAYGG